MIYTPSKIYILSKIEQGEYLGMHGDSDGQQALHETFDISAVSETISVEFDIIEIDD